ncbi:conserved membrane hypothetical protein [Vibrio chagasii]|nr:conserved membrane hypothetical protein [Vibrio chagasii]
MTIINKLRYVIPAVIAVSAPSTLAMGLADVIENLQGGVSAFVSLLAIVLILVGMYCIYQLVMTFTNRDEGNRDYPMKNVPYYFIGAALGIGAMAMNNVVLETLFGDSGSGISGGDNSDLWTPSD